MKALSIRQPWAWLIAQGIKDVENRSWRTHFRGRFLLHAGERVDAEGYRQIRTRRKLRALLPRDFPEPQEFQHGGIVGEAVLFDCVEGHPSPWFNGPFGFVLAEQRPLPFLPCRGMLSFFTLPNDVEIAVRRLQAVRASRSSP